MEVILNSECLINANTSSENYDYADDEEVRRLSRYMLIKHEEAYKALANA